MCPERERADSCVSSAECWEKVVCGMQGREIFFLLFSPFVAPCWEQKPTKIKGSAFGVESVYRRAGWRQRCLSWQNETESAAVLSKLHGFKSSMTSPFFVSIFCVFWTLEICSSRQSFGIWKRRLPPLAKTIDVVG